MLLGMLLAISTIAGVGRNLFPPAYGDLAAIGGAVVVPLLVLAIPFLDVALAVIRRTRRGVGLGVADKEHLHHRLVDIGHGHRQTVLLMYLWSALISGCGLAIGLINGRLVVGIILFGAAILFAVTAFPLLGAQRERGWVRGGRAARAPGTRAGSVRPPGPAASYNREERRGSGRWLPKAVPIV